MPETLHPGIYIQEVPPQARAIESASTSTAAFIGVTDRGPVDKAVLVTSFLQYTSKFGGFRKDSLLTYSVLKFFENGGRNCYIVRTMPTVSTPPPNGVTPPSTASLKVKNTYQLDSTTPQDVMQIFAGAYWTDNNGTSQNGEPGRWGNDLTVTIEDGSTNSENEFKVNIKKNDETLESFDDLSILKDTSNYFEAVINNASLYISVNNLLPKEKWPSTGFLKSGKSPGTNLSDPKKLSISIDNLAPVTIDLSPPEDVADGKKIAATITKKVKAAGSTAAFTNFSCVFVDDQYILKSGSFASTDSDVKMNASVKILRITSPEQDINNDASEVLKLTPPTGAHQGFYYMKPDQINDISIGSSKPGSDGQAIDGGPLQLSSGDFIGDSSNMRGLHALDKINDVSIISIPGNGEFPRSPLATPPAYAPGDLKRMQSIISSAINYCSLRSLGDCFFIADMPSTALDISGSTTFSNEISRSDYGAIYFPWLICPDPIGIGKNPTILLPPSGFVAGIYARTDAKRGYFKAPAGTEANIVGAVGLSSKLDDSEQDKLNPKGLNLLRSFPGYGLLVWGARTLGTDAAWRYIPVRRTAIFLRVSIYNGIQWAVFEGNDESLWSSLRLNIESFMLTQFRAGAFQGKSPTEAYFVKCDKDTTTQQDIDRGIVNVLVGFAPLKPAEFVVIKLSQKIGQAT